MVALSTPTKEVEEIRPSTFKSMLETKFGPEWFELENETISLELGMALTPLVRDKIDLLRVLVINPQLFYEDALFFLHACDVFNNSVANFDHFPHPNSLQIAWAIDEMSRISEGQFSYDVKEVVTCILRNEGYSNAPGPLLLACFLDKLEPGQEAEDRADKASAVDQYIAHMKASK